MIVDEAAAAVFVLALKPDLLQILHKLEICWENK